MSVPYYFFIPWANTITKSNEDRVLDLIGVLPSSAEKE
jgi:hypothetical protein